MATRKNENQPKQAEPAPETAPETAPRVTRVSHQPVIHPSGRDDNRTLAPHIERARQAEIRRSLHAHRAPPHGRGRGR